MASITGTVTVAGDPDDWIATAFDAETHAFAGVSAVAAGVYEITGLTAGRAYVVACRPKTGGARTGGKSVLLGEYIIPSDPASTPYVYKASNVYLNGDPYWESVVLSMNCEGTEGDTNFSSADAKGHSMSGFNGVQFDTDRKKFGSSSLLFDGSDDFLRVSSFSDLRLTTSESLTIEFWSYPAEVPSNKELLSIYDNSSYISIRLELLNGITPTLKFYFNGSQFFLTHSTPITINNWHHIAAVRESDTWTLYLDGVPSSSADGGDAMDSPPTLYVGREPIQNWGFAGSLDDIRITKGVARYTGEFTPPDVAFPQFTSNPVTAVSEPIWPLTVGEIVVDGDITWTNMGRIIRPLVQGPLVAV